MFEQTFYNLLNSIMEMSDEEIKNFLDNHDDFLNSLLYNKELINDVKKQMRLENISTTDMMNNKENLLADMRALTKPIELTEERKQVYEKILEVVNKIYDEAMEDFSRETINVSVELCNINAKVPTYAHKDDAGFDFYLPEDFTIKAHEYGKIAPTGLKMSIPSGYELQIRPRSGNSVKTTLRIANAPGTIDCGYANEIGIICDNIGDEDLTFKRGDRIAQGIFAAVPKGKFNVVKDINTVTGINRGGGFGSSGQ